jgi:predicted secreted protein
MPTAGIINGSQYTVMFDSDGGSPVIADHVTDLSVSISTDTRDTTTKNNGGYRAILPGLKSLSVNFTAYYANNATNGFDELMADFLAGTKQTVKISSIDWDATSEPPAPTEIAGDMEISFEAYITSLELSAGVEDNTSYTCTLECVSAITYAAHV